MRLMLLTIALTVLVPGFVSAQSVRQTAAVEQEIRRLDHADAVLRGDLAAMG